MKKRNVFFGLLMIFTLVLSSCGDILGSEVDKSALTTAIETAEELRDSKTIGTETGQVPQAAVTTYTTAIETAQNVVDNIDATDEEISAAVTALAAATVIFNNSIISDSGNGEDSIAPVITLTGDVNVNIAIGDTYTDAGATATDNVDGDITSAIVTVSTVDTTTAGDYTVTYDVSDAAGNSAVTVVRNVIVSEEVTPDTTELFTFGDSVLVLDTDFTVTSAIEGTDWGSGTVVTSTNDTSTEYTTAISADMGTGWGPAAAVAYNFAAGTLTGADYLNVKIKSTHNADGADFVEFQLIGATQGNPTLIYDTDEGWNVLDNGWVEITLDLAAFGDDLSGVTNIVLIDKDSVVQTIYITDLAVTPFAPELIGPSISLLGDATVTVNVGETYTDAGATASDNVDGDISDSITIDGTVDVDTAGEYTLTYNVTDSDGNAAVAVTRTVVVVDLSTTIDAELFTISGVAQVLDTDFTITSAIGGTDWGSGTVITSTENNSMGYTPVIEAQMGSGWGPAVAVAYNFDAGTLTNQTTLTLKIKSVHNQVGADFVEFQIVGASDNAARLVYDTDAGWDATSLEDGWVQVTLDLTLYGDLSTATNLVIVDKDSIVQTVYITDVVIE